MGLFYKTYKPKPLSKTIPSGTPIRIGGDTYDVGAWWGLITVVVTFTEVEHPIQRPRYFMALFLRMIGKK